MDKKQEITEVKPSEKNKAFESARQLIEKQFGKGSLIQLGSSTAVHEGLRCIPSGSMKLDRALGVGGYPRGRVIEIYGPESTGKTTLALHAIAEAQKLGGTAAFIDAEHALDPTYAKNLGVDIDNLWLSQPDNGEQALEITEQLVRSGATDIIVIDSVAALTPKAEIAGLMGDASVGTQARLMSQALRKLTGILSKTSCCLIFINQIRMKIGVMYGSPETTSGGNALKFYASIRLDIRRVDRISSGTDNFIGNKVKVKVVKNKVAPPFKVVDFAIYYGKGISQEENILEMATEFDLIQKTGSWYSLNDEKLGQGKENVIQYLLDNLKVRDMLLKKVREKMFEKEKEGKKGAAKEEAAAGSAAGSSGAASAGAGSGSSASVAASAGAASVAASAAVTPSAGAAVAARPSAVAESKEPLAKETSQKEALPQ